MTCPLCRQYRLSLADCPAPELGELTYAYQRHITLRHRGPYVRMMMIDVETRGDSRLVVWTDWRMREMTAEEWRGKL